MICFRVGAVSVHQGRQGLDWTRATSRLEELRLQGDQPHRGLCLVAGGIQGISPIKDYHHLQPGGIGSRDRHINEELRGESLINFSHTIMLWSTEEESWLGGCLHLLGIMIVAEE